MSKRMTDERITDIHLHLDDKTGPPREKLAWELLTALKAERARVKELETELEEERLDHMATIQQEQGDE